MSRTVLSACLGFEMLSEGIWKSRTWKNKCITMERLNTIHWHITLFQRPIKSHAAENPPLDLHLILLSIESHLCKSPFLLSGDAKIARNPDRWRRSLPILTTHSPNFAWICKFNGLMHQLAFRLAMFFIAYLRVRAKVRLILYRRQSPAWVWINPKI